MGLLSAGSTSNNNIIIPMIPMRRPVSNFNFGGGQLWNNFENNTKNMMEKAANINEEKNTNINNNLKKEENEIILDAELNKKGLNLNPINPKKSYNIYNKSNNNNISIAKTSSLKPQDMKKQFDSFPIKNDTNNVYIGMDKMITKLHKIKIEKGMMNLNIVNSLNKKFNNDYQNQIEQFKKSHLPMMFNSQTNNKSNKMINMNLNNNDKNKVTKNHRFNSKNY